MKTGNRIVDRNLDRAAGKWRGVRFLHLASLAGSVTCGFFLLLALAMYSGWLTSPGWAKTLIVFALVIAGVFVLGAAIAVVEKDPDRRWLAGVVEGGQPELQDRVNTLVALEKIKNRTEVKPFYQRIAEQAQAVMFDRPPSIPVPSDKAKLHGSVFLALLAITFACYWAFSPWDRMLAARLAKLEAAKTQLSPTNPPPALELAGPTNAVEQKLPWGEVRITEPARDLQVTKVDVVPLQIEAAANEPLQSIAWNSSINGSSGQRHDLPAPKDPRFAVYQPSLYLDEFKLSDWDVMTYFAKADTRSSNAFASEVYFLEVRPFREDIAKMPGGEGGKAMQCINELSSLISQQQHVIRQTHQHTQSPPESQKMREQDRAKLAEAEADLSKAAEHLYADMASKMENTPIGDALDNLAKAEKKLDQASRSLRENQLDQGQKEEHSALADLVAARKAFQKAVSENPDNFAERSNDPSPPTADAKNKLEKMAEFRDEAKAAQQFMERLVQRQRNLSGMSSLTNASSFVRNSTFPMAQSNEQAIAKSLQEFREQHPQVFKPVRPEGDQAQQSLNQAADALARKEPQAAQQMKKATENLEKLAEAMKDKSADQQLADAYKLKEMLDQQIQKMGQCQNPGSSGQGAPSAAEMKQVASEARQTLQQLKSAAEQSPLNEEFGPELGESLSDASMSKMNRPLGELQQAASQEQRQMAAGEAKQGMENVSKAFEKSQPQSMQAAKRAGKQGQQGDAQSEFERGLAQLESLIKQAKSNRPISKQDQAKLGQEALANLQSGMKEKGGSNERGNQMLTLLDKELKKGEEPVDVEILKSVMDALRAFSVELASKKGLEDKPEMTGLDPSRLPPAYRGRIETYFKKLSEK